MRVYHGTSFENACKILSMRYWEYPIELYLLGEYRLQEQLGNDQYVHKPLKETLGNHFTTSLAHAKTYAVQHDKPVVLFFDYDLIEGSCLDFIIDEPIDTLDIKCIEVCLNRHMSYGLLCNQIYGKPTNNATQKVRFF